MNDWENFRKTEAILRESMRIFPPVWGFSRLAEAADIIDGFKIPKGAMVFVSPWVLHRNPHLYPNPEGFEPERFAGELMQTLPKCAYMPFGAGARQCIGAAFAMMEAKVVLATLAQRYRFFLEMGASSPRRCGHYLPASSWYEDDSSSPGLTFDVLHRH